MDGLAADGGDDVTYALSSGLPGDGCELGQRFAVGTNGVSEVAYGIDVVETSEAEIRFSGDRTGRRLVRKGVKALWQETSLPAGAQCRA